MEAEITALTTLGTPVRIQITLEVARLCVVIWKGSCVSATIHLNAHQIDQFSQMAERAAGRVVRQTAP